MTVAEAIAKLTALPQDALLVLSRDAEGNDHAPAFEIHAASYDPTERTVTIGEDAPANAIACVCIWPS